MPAPDSAPATKADLAAARSELSSKIDSVRSDLSAEVGSVRSDLAASTRRLALEIVGTNARIDRLETSLRAEMARNASDIKDTIDKFAMRSENASKAIVLHGQTITEMQVKLMSHDQRLGALDAPRP